MIRSTAVRITDRSAGSDRPRTSCIDSFLNRVVDKGKAVLRSSFISRSLVRTYSIRMLSPLHRVNAPLRVVARRRTRATRCDDGERSQRWNFGTRIDRRDRTTRTIGGYSIAVDRSIDRSASWFGSCRRQCVLRRTRFAWRCLRCAAQILVRILFTIA